MLINQFVLLTYTRLAELPSYDERSQLSTLALGRIMNTSSSILPSLTAPCCT